MAMNRTHTVQRFHWGFRLVADLVIVCLATACASSPPSGAVPGLPAPPPPPPGAFPAALPAVATPPAPTAPAEYRLNIGDIVEISMYRQDVRENDDLRRQVTVRPDGRISYFFVGDTQALGLTTEELRLQLRDKLSRYVRSPELAVILVEPAKKHVYVVGEVFEQGARDLRAGQNDSVLDSIFLSKGLKKSANVDRAYVIRQDALIEVELGEVLFRGNRAKDVVLQTGDVVYIPEALEQKVMVLGYFKQPGAYEVSRPIRLTEAVALGGDFILDAKRDGVTIIRGGLPRAQTPPKIETVDVSAILAGKQADTYVQRGDIVFAPATTLASYNEVLVQLLPTLTIMLLSAAFATR